MKELLRSVHFIKGYGHYFGNKIIQIDPFLHHMSVTLTLCTRVNKQFQTFSKSKIYTSGPLNSFIVKTQAGATIQRNVRKLSPCLDNVL